MLNYSMEEEPANLKKLEGFNLLALQIFHSQPNTIGLANPEQPL